MKIWERRTIFFEINVLKSYLYTTVKNASLNWLKQNGKTKTLTEDVANEKLQCENLAFQQVVEAEVFDILTSALDELSPKGKRIIQMIYFEGKKIREVAEELGVAQSTVKTQKQREMIKLKKSFKNLNLFTFCVSLLIILVF